MGLYPEYDQLSNIYVYNVPTDSGQQDAPTGRNPLEKTSNTPMFRTTIKTTRRENGTAGQYKIDPCGR